MMRYVKWFYPLSVKVFNPLYMNKLLLFSALLLVGCNEVNVECPDFNQVQHSLNNIERIMENVECEEKEVTVQAPFCQFAADEYISYQVNQNVIDYENTDLEACKMLMFGHEGSNIMYPNLYDALGEWIKESDGAIGGLEDRIASHVLLTLIWCFQNT